MQPLKNLIGPKTRLAHLGEQLDKLASYIPGQMRFFRHYFDFIALRGNR